MGSIKDRNGMDLTEAEDIKKRWQEYTEELYKKDLHNPEKGVAPEPGDGVLVPTVTETRGQRECLGPCSPRDSQESSPTPQFKSINSLALSFLHSPTLTSTHNYRKNHCLD